MSNGSEMSYKEQELRAQLAEAERNYEAAKNLDESEEALKCAFREEVQDLQQQLGKLMEGR